MDKIDYSDYIVIDDDENQEMVLLKNMVDKINEIIDWINAQ